MDKNKNYQKGVSLYITFIVMAILIASALGVSIILLSGMKTMKNIEDSIVAFYAADSGIENYLYDPNIPQSSEIFLQGSSGASFSIDKDRTCVNNTVSVGTYNGTKRAIQIISSCGETVSYGGKKYRTVLIGCQCWFAQNLNVVNGETDKNCAFTRYCYDNDSANCDTNNNPTYSDGGLYTWDNAMCGSTIEGAQGICPNGWHISTNAEWDTLVNYLGGLSIAGEKMKPDGISGFEGNLAGLRDTNGNFGDRTVYSFFWSSSQHSPSNAWRQRLYSKDSTVNKDLAGKENGFSVRCIKD